MFITDIELPRKKVQMSLEGIDGNAFSILGAFKSKARSQGWKNDQIQRVLNEAMEGDYHHLLSTILSHTYTKGESAYYENPGLEAYPSELAFIDDILTLEETKWVIPHPTNIILTDPCYLLKDSNDFRWQDIVDEMYGRSENSPYSEENPLNAGFMFISERLPVLFTNTAYGDGRYNIQHDPDIEIEGSSLAVDAGLIGACRLDDLPMDIQDSIDYLYQAMIENFQGIIWVEDNNLYLSHNNSLKTHPSITIHTH